MYADNYLNSLYMFPHRIRFEPRRAATDGKEHRRWVAGYLEPPVPLALDALSSAAVGEHPQPAPKTR